MKAQIERHPLSWLLVVPLVVVLAACRGPEPCVPVATEGGGSIERNYDEFRQVTSLTAELLLTPDAEWEQRDYRENAQILWSMAVWLQVRSNGADIDLTVRPTCSGVPEGSGEAGQCLNCDNVCTKQSGMLEVVADGRPIPLPVASYQRLPTEGPTPDSPATWTSSLTLRVPPEALAPVTHARTVKLRACGSIVTTLPPAELATVQEFLRHAQAIIPPRPGAPPPGVR